MITQIAAPSAEPVSLDEAKAHLRLDGTAEDALIGALISAARLHVEAATGRALCTQVWEEQFDAFPEDTAFVELPKPPLSSVQQVAWLDATGAMQQALLADFQTIAPVGPFAQPGSVGPKSGKSWPTGLSEQPLSARIRFVAGYGDAASVPAPLKAALLLVLGDLYQNREAQIVGSTVSDNATVKSLLAPFRVFYA
jgi:uncharacterized phiE125 gp8 family phage protein